MNEEALAHRGLSRQKQTNTVLGMPVLSCGGLAGAEQLPLASGYALFVCWRNISASNRFCHSHLKCVTDDPSSKPEQRYARRRDRQNYIRKMKYKFETSSKKISKLVQYWYVGKVRTSRLLLLSL